MTPKELFRQKMNENIYRKHISDYLKEIKERWRMRKDWVIRHGIHFRVREIKLIIEDYPDLATEFGFKNEPK